MSRRKRHRTVKAAAPHREGMETVARLRAAPERLARLVRETTLSPTAGDVHHGRVLFALEDEGLSAPARSRSPAVYTSYDPAYFDSFAVEQPGHAVLETAPTLRWLDWLDDDVVTVTFSGEEGQAIERVEIRAADHHVVADPLGTAAVVDSLDLGLPADFDEAGRFAPDGDPAPTRVETDAATLARLVEAADIVDGDGVPVVVADGELRLSVTGDAMSGSGTLPTRRVEGADCQNWYGPDLAAITRTITGCVRLELVPGGPMAVTQVDEHAERRYVLEQTM